MKMNWKNLLTIAMMACAAMSITACDDDDDESEDNSNTSVQREVNKMFVENTVQPTYEGLAAATAKMIASLEKGNYTQAGTDWKEARQYWEWSEAFLFGAASGYGIDPHIDTWPFDAASFNSYLSKYNPATNSADAALLEEAIATGQNLTGFHAVEYLLFREGKVRTDITSDEAWFCEAAANDLYLNATKLVAAWDGHLTDAQKSLLEEVEAEPADHYGEEFVNAGVAGSRWKTALAANIEIIEGARTIIDEVASAKIGAPFSGDDTNYIESPHAYNSIVDFYDNIMSCKHALYGLKPSTSNYSVTTPAAGSLMAVALKEAPVEAAAAMAALEASLKAIDNMPKPFVKYYTDAKVGQAIEALKVLDEALESLEDAIQK